ncbi:hypothetical protein AVEN_216917-1 [Araneus ventricosus]|uniref:Tc1-like transposase DDE domain-containing protein n=1 Tax=Araneus ventricosus TaxID=182803 RepID=A0A4Y2MZ61_ARAVE|nr:hypothetical protein AVEN_216917-1 [Araneus ventricosus]
MGNRKSVETVWLGLTTSLIIGSFFFEGIGPTGPVTCTVNDICCKSLLRKHVIPALQQSPCVSSTIFMQDGAPPHVAHPLKRLLSMHFGNYRIISRRFPTNWLPRSPHLNPCDFWL